MIFKMFTSTPYFDNYDDISDISLTFLIYNKKLIKRKIITEVR